MRQVRRVLRRAGYVLLGVALLVFAAWDGSMADVLRWLRLSRVTVSPELFVRVVCAALLAGLVVFLGYRFRVHWKASHLTDLAPGKPLLDGDSDVDEHDDEILSSIDAIAARYADETLAVFYKMLTDPATQVRVTEEVEPMGESLRIAVSTTFALPDLDSSESVETRPAVVLVPFIKATKGTMLDNIDTSDMADAAVPFLSQRDARGLIALVLWALFEFTFVGDANGLTAQQQKALRRLLRLVSQPGRVVAKDVKVQLDAVLAHAGTPRSDEDVQRLRGFVTFFAVNYIVVAEVAAPVGTRLVLRYSKTIPQYGRADSRRSIWRVRVGLGAYRFIVPINNAFTAASYHFRMNGGPNRYVRWHYLMEMPSGTPVKQERIRQVNGPVYVRLRHRQALPYAHLYTRGISTKGEQLNLATVVEFAEVPPGALGVTFALAAAETLLLLFLALFVPSSDGVASDVLAFLLTVPVLAATFVGYSADAVQRSTFATVLGLLLVGATSFVAAAVYVQHAPNWMLLHKPVLFGFLHLRAINLVVLTIGLVTICNAVHLYWRLRAETGHYIDRLKEKNSVGMMFR